jgi:tryprostatin B 6-hydroxylase
MDDLKYPLAFIAGITSHLLYFHRGEHHLNGILYLSTFLSVTAIAVVAIHTVYAYELFEAFKLVALVETVYLTGIYSSLLLYRAFLNPLNKFPGPFAARLTGFWWSVHNGTESHAFLKNEALHKKYGPFVRITPSTLSVAHPDAPELFYGHKSKCRKAEWYVKKP